MMLHHNRNYKPKCSHKFTWEHRDYPGMGFIKTFSLLDSVAMYKFGQKLAKDKKVFNVKYNHKVL